MTTIPAPPPVRRTTAPGLLTDGDLVALPSARTPRALWHELVDRLVGSDPGLQQLRTAVRSVLGMALAVLAAWALVAGTGALQVDPAGRPAAVVAAQHHGALVIAIIIAAITAMMVGFGVNDRTTRGQLLTTGLLPVPLWLAMTVGVALDRFRPLLLVWLVLALMTGMWLRRFGPRGNALGLVLFQGAFLGYFLGPQLSAGDLGWIAVDIGVGALAAGAVRFAVLYRGPAATLRAMWTSWRSRARRLLLIAAELTDASCTDRRRAALHERMRRALLRLSESTLMIDGQLADPEASPAALLLHQRLFDMELTLTNVCRFAVALTDRCDQPDVREPVGAALHALQALDDAAARAALERLAAVQPTDATVAVLVDRFTGSVTALHDARAEFVAVAGTGAGVPTDDDATRADPNLPPAESSAAVFTPAVTLAGGYLPGSVPVSEQAAALRGTNRWLDSSRLPNHVRASIQVGVAATIAIVVGGWLSDQRLYWALLATFLAFMATSNTGEQVRKALFRVAGTAIGIVVGALVVHLVHANLVASLAVIAVAMFLGIYLLRVNYTFMVVGITITMSLLYVQLGEFSWSLLLLRLEETAIGVGAVVLTVLVVVPLRPQRVLAAGTLLWFRALTVVVDRSLATVTGAGQVTRADVRGLDVAYQSLVVAAKPMQHATFGRNGSQLREILAVATAGRNYARNLSLDVQVWPHPPAAGTWDAATSRLRESMAVIDRRIECRESAPYVRSAALFDPVARALPGTDRREQLMLRDVTLLDGALARLAAALRLPVEDLDTTPTAPGAPAVPSTAPAPASP